MEADRRGKGRERAEAWGAVEQKTLSGQRLNQDKAGEIKKWQKAVNPDSVLLAIEQILAGEQYIRLNANITLVTENVLLNISRLLRKAS